jgi:hypothetical protein
MKLTTDILPRKDGTVIVKTPSGGTYVLKKDGEGRLAAEVTNEADIAYLLDNGNFYPLNEGDIEAGLDALNAGDEDDEEEDQAPEAVEAPIAEPINEPAVAPVPAQRKKSK